MEKKVFYGQQRCGECEEILDHNNLLEVFEDSLTCTDCLHKRIYYNGNLITPSIKKIIAELETVKGVNADEMRIRQKAVTILNFFVEYFK